MSYIGSSKIGKMYLGSTEMAKAYLGSSLVYQNGGVQPTIIPYIRGGADGSYIDTGITPDQTTKVIVWARNFNPYGSKYTHLFGSLVASNNAMFYLSSMNRANAGNIRMSYGSAGTTVYDKWTAFSHYHKYEFGPNGLYIDNVFVSAVSAETFSNNYNIHLFGINNAGTHNEASLPIDIAACKIYKNGSLVRDYTTVETPSVGLYDAVSDTVFTNAGSGSFTYGEFDKNAYTPLEYISDDGGAYFDSGAKGGYSIPLVSKFRFTDNTKNVSLLGYRGSSDWCEFDINYGSAVKMYYRLASTATWGALYNATSTNFVDQDIVLVKEPTNSASIYKNNAQIGSTIAPGSSASYVTSGNLCIGALNLGSSYVQPFTGRIYYVGIGSSRSFVPAKKNGVAGMYDTYNDVFYPSVTETPFVAGPTI